MTWSPVAMTPPPTERLVMAHLPPNTDSATWPNRHAHHFRPGLSLHPYRGEHPDVGARGTAARGDRASRG